MASKKSLKVFLNLVAIFAKIFFKMLAWFYNHPELVLGIWVAFWATLVMVVLNTSGPTMVSLLLTSGCLNLFSLIGVVVPMSALAVMFSKTILPVTWKFLEDVFYRIFRKVRNEFIKAYKQIQKLLVSIGKKMAELWAKLQELFQKIADLPAEIEEDVKRVISGATDMAKNVGNKIKNLLGTEVRAINVAHKSLLDDLDELDRLAPETNEYTSGIRDASNNAVATVLASVDGKRGYLGSWGGAEGIVAELQESVKGYYTALTRELQNSGTLL